MSLIQIALLADTPPVAWMCVDRANVGQSEFWDLPVVNNHVVIVVTARDSERV